MHRRMVLVLTFIYRLRFIASIPVDRIGHFVGISLGSECKRAISQAIIVASNQQGDRLLCKIYLGLIAKLSSQ